MAAMQGCEELKHFSGFPENEELTPECEVVYEGESLDVEAGYINCTKNPGHESFISVKDFGLDHLPEEIRNPGVKRLVDLKCYLTVRIKVDYTSLNRPDKYADSKKAYPYSTLKGSNREKRFGTGFILMSSITGPVYKECTCRLCLKSGVQENKIWRIVVKTSTHVIYDETEAPHADFECFYDSKDREGIESFCGDCFIKPTTSSDYNYKSDLCLVECIVHEKLVYKLWSLAGRYYELLFNDFTLPPEEVMVSHPHGGSKKISLGKIVCLTFPVEPNYKTGVPILLDDVITCSIPLDSTASSLPNTDEDDFQWKHTRDWFSTCFKAERYFPQDFSRYRRYTIISGDEKDIAFRLLYFTALHFIASLDRFLMSEVSSSRTLHKCIHFLISERLKVMANSDTKHPTLFDIGLILWHYFLVISMEYFQYIDTSNHKLDSNFFSPIVNVVLKYMLYKLPPLRTVFGIHVYLIDNSIHEAFESTKHLSKDDMKDTLVRVLTGNKNMSLTRDMRETIFSFVSNIENGLNKMDNNIENGKSVQMPNDKDYLKPGKTSVLPSHMTFTLPAKAKFAYEYYRGKNPYFQFPRGTKFNFLLEGTLEHRVPIPDGAKFRTYGGDPTYIYYAIYNTCTCPGSSGASVHLGSDKIRMCPFHVHSCGLKNKNNRSGLSFLHGGNKDAKDFLKVMDNVQRDTNIIKPGPLVMDSFIEKHGSKVEALIKEISDNPRKVFDFIRTVPK